jgi:glycosyltransferase involved in cell wall biosynthesis
MAMTEGRPNLSVVIPCYNEEKNLERGVLDEVYGYLKEQSFSWEVVICNDESTDKSRTLIEAFIRDKPGFSLYDIPHGGKPAAVWGGIQHARGEIILFTDMDQSTPIVEWAKLAPGFEQGYDVVIGSRGMTREGFSLVRKLGSQVFRTLRATFLLKGIKDTQCGFKACRREVALDVFPRLQFFEQETPTGWKVSAYDVELLHLCELAGYTIQEVVVEWRNRDESETKGKQGELARYLGESVDMAREVLRVTSNQRRGLYDR